MLRNSLNIVQNVLKPAKDAVLSVCTESTADGTVRDSIKAI